LLWLPLKVLRKLLATSFRILALLNDARNTKPETDMKPTNQIKLTRSVGARRNLTTLTAVASHTLTVSDTAPDFSAIAVGAEFAEGKPFRLSDYFPEQIVLYFYPQDHTPGCTAQACKLRDAWAEFGNRASLFGISTDSLESHRPWEETLSGQPL
jgi:AhpC/TSA family